LNKQKLSRKEIYEIFLKENRFYIDYNGVLYTMVDKENNVIIQTQTSEEITLFILGWNSAENKYQEEIKDLQEANLQLNKLNNDNIERYEKIISDFGGESMTTTSEEIFEKDFLKD